MTASQNSWRTTHSLLKIYRNYRNASITLSNISIHNHELCLKVLKIHLNTVYLIFFLNHICENPITLLTQHFCQFVKVLLLKQYWQISHSTTQFYILQLIKKKRFHWIMSLKKSQILKNKLNTLQFYSTKVTGWPTQQSVFLIYSMNELQWIYLLLVDTDGAKRHYPNCEVLPSYLIDI